MELYDHQIKAVEELGNGKILCGGVGTGKSRTALTYYFLKECEGSIPINGKGEWGMMMKPRPLYIITTAKKRDSLEWEMECSIFHLSDDEDESMNGMVVTVDSWNNIKKYDDVVGAFFIFDEQRVVGKGAWVKAFLRIARRNHWILLSATPGDTWSDYIPVFLANGFYKSRTEFNQCHCVFSRFAKYPLIERYVDTGRLIRLRREILVTMKFDKETIPKHIAVTVPYDRELYLTVARKRWNPYENEPIDETGKLCYLMRKVVNDSPYRVNEVMRILSERKRAIIFYNFTYELERLRAALDEVGLLYSEWNGEKHEDVPKGDTWAYLVQYAAGAEGWNCITTDTIIFYSLNYSYRTTIQAEGRIDRLNTPYKELYYYSIRSTAPIDVAIQRALGMKRNFNEKAFIGS